LDTHAAKVNPYKSIIFKPLNHKSEKYKNERKTLITAVKL